MEHSGLLDKIGQFSDHIEGHSMLSSFLLVLLVQDQSTYHVNMVRNGPFFIDKAPSPELDSILRQELKVKADTLLRELDRVCHLSKSQRHSIGIALASDARKIMRKFGEVEQARKSRNNLALLQQQLTELSNQKREYGLGENKLTFSVYRSKMSEAQKMQYVSSKFPYAAEELRRMALEPSATDDVLCQLTVQSNLQLPNSLKPDTQKRLVSKIVKRLGY